MAAGFFKAFDFFTDEFEACQHVHQFHAVSFAHGADHFCTYDGFDNCAVCGQSAFCFLLGQDVFCQQCAGHITCKHYIFAFVIAYHCAYTVTVRVCAHDDVRAFFFCQFLCQHEYLRVFWVRITNRCEIGVGHFLFFYHIYLMEACFFQCSAHGQVTGTVDRCVNDFQIVCHFFDDFWRLTLCQHVCVKSIVHIFGNILEQTFCLCFVHCHFFDFAEACHSVYFCDDVFISGCNNLCAVCPVNFVTVVFGGVMAGCDNDTSCAAQFPYSKAQHGCGTQRRVYISTDAVACQYQTSDLSKFGGHMAGVISDGYAFVLCAFFQDVVCQTLCGTTYSVTVQTVAACPNDSAQTACTKFQVFVKTFFDFLFVCGNFPQIFFCCFVNGGVCQPLMVSFHVIQFDSSLCSLSLFVYAVSSSAAAVFGMVCRKKEGLT